jgi:hypothetical protein
MGELRGREGTERDLREGEAVPSFDAVAEFPVAFEGFAGNLAVFVEEEGEDVLAGCH